MIEVLDESNLTFCYVVDSSGFIISSRLIDLDSRKLEPTEVSVTKFPFFYRPRWTGNTWIEGATQEEIDEMTRHKLSPPTDTEILGQQMTEREIEAMYQGQQLSDMELRLLVLEGM